MDHRLNIVKEILIKIKKRMKYFIHRVKTGPSLFHFNAMAEVLDMLLVNREAQTNMAGCRPCGVLFCFFVCLFFVNATRLCPFKLK